MAGNDGGGVRQRQQTGLDGFDDLVEVAAGKIGAADAFGEQCVSGDNHLERLEMEAYRALRVPGSVEYLGGVAVESNAAAFGQGFVGWGGVRRRNADPGCLGRHHGKQWQIVFVEIDGCAGECFELERAAHVVNMGVGNENLPELETKLGQAAVNAGNLVAWIDDNRLASFLVAHQGAVALQGADWECLENHGFIVERKATGIRPETVEADP